MLSSIFKHCRDSSPTPIKVIALGGFASQVLHKLGVEHFKLPHPSGRNRLLNDRNYEAEQLKLCREYLNK